MTAWPLTQVLPDVRRGRFQRRVDQRRNRRREIGAFSALLATGSAAFLLAACSDPVPPPAQAALTSALFSATGSCASPRTTLSVGDTPQDIERDGGEGRVTAGVSCTVKQTDTGFDFDGNVSDAEIMNSTAALSLSASATIASASCSVDQPCTATGQMQLYDNFGMQTRSLSDAACTFEIKVLKPGAIWSGYRCDDFKDPNTPGNVCTSTGQFVFENCKQ